MFLTCKSFSPISFKTSGLNLSLFIKTFLPDNFIDAHYLDDEQGCFLTVIRNIIFFFGYGEENQVKFRMGKKLGEKWCVKGIKKKGKYSGR